MYALVQLGQEIPQSYIDVFLKALGMKIRNVRKAAAGALVQLGQEIPKSYIDTLLKALEDKDEDVRVRRCERAGSAPTSHALRHRCAPRGFGG